MNKKLQLLTFVLTLASFPLWAQQARQVNVKPTRSATTFTLPQSDLQLRAQQDTILFPAAEEDCSNQVTSFGITGNWGLVAGTNEYGDREKAQRLFYNANSPYRVTEVWGFFAEAAVVGNGTIRAKVYAANAANGGPGTLLGTSRTLNTSNVRTDAQGVPVTIFPFSTPATVSDDEFFVSIDFSALYAAGDTVGLFHTRQDCGSGDDTWELFSDGTTWAAVNSDLSWQFDANWIVAAVVEFDASTSVKDPFVAQNGLQIFPAVPNPTHDWVQLPYQLESNTTVNIEVYSADGKLLQRMYKGEQLSGRYVEQIDTQSLANGTYVYSIVTEKSRILSRFVVSH
ncbi:MAG: T9SS type A sorting domain-containing protein [Saprospiraceae bacterium]